MGLKEKLGNPLYFENEQQLNANTTGLDSMDDSILSLPLFECSNNASVSSLNSNAGTSRNIELKTNELSHIEQTFTAAHNQSIQIVFNDDIPKKVDREMNSTFPLSNVENKRLIQRQELSIHLNKDLAKWKFKKTTILNKKKEAENEFMQLKTENKKIGEKIVDLQEQIKVLERDIASVTYKIDETKEKIKYYSI